ncbi:UvrD-helicase domain-containing protein [Paenibacillus sp. UMB7766-LJ446]|uniref:UvrD-helicase domain-containing protein n=1 Tax=Paenibacillus sp. UMB7766-LJ446 TaxID=3046313 RepID=UPI00254F4107|nr:UvrD-helicase domain-containing protein [Paenibacillus sp. UMB7766-LJ446]MDK8193476.1 UvrD-helicase domain-containing protein [Paenibacillus sp. UMB7766-LJ446]
MNDFDKSTAFMSLKEHKRFIDRYMQNKVYLDKGDPFEVHKKIKQEFNKLHKWVLKTSKYKTIVQLYEHVQQESYQVYISTLEQLQIIQTHNSKYDKKINHALSELEQLKQDYITNSAKLHFAKKYEEVYCFFRQAGKDELSERQKGFINIFSDKDAQITFWNQEYIRANLQTHSAFFDDIDGKSLDEQQRISVLTDEDNNLVLAGAGSGKTLTIAGKVKFLTQIKKVRPEEILLISFTNKAAGEMQERISNRLHVNVDVKTFHKLGNGIIAKHVNVKQSISDELRSYVQTFFDREILTRPVLLQHIVQFFGVYFNIPRDRSEFETIGEYHESQRGLDFESLKSKLQRMNSTDQTLKGETMKSLEEIMIANFLFLNGVEYEYEKNYEYDTATKEFRQYQPDFYLTKYGLYLEHFGVNEQMRAPWLKGIEEKKYIQGVHWKRGLHAEKGTICIESFSYYNQNGVLLSKLSENLQEYGVEFNEVNALDLYELLCSRQNNQQFEEFVKLICSFINLFKSSGYSGTDFDRLKHENRISENNPFLRKRTELFFEIVRPIYEFYQASIAKERRIDFNDMINEATRIARLLESNFNYRYIIIDEYQDISKSRFGLVKAIKDKTGAKVMCVGDDWQSIYRFAGSDLDLFTRFGEYFGAYETMKIEQTYRNSQELIDIAGQFVMRNKKQLTKKLKSAKSTSQPIKIHSFSDNMGDVVDAIIESIVQKYGVNSTIMLLGRNNMDIKQLDGHHGFNVDVNKHLIKSEKYPSLQLSFMSAHKSKGLEAHNVIVINGRNAVLGFPNRMSDDPVLQWVLTAPDSLAFAEERRLFYVALTRTENELFIVVPEREKSLFVNELIKDYKVPLILSGSQTSIASNPKCLTCNTGTLVERKGKGGKSFLGCSNYPGCRRTYSDIRIIKNQVRCATCKGYMVVRRSKNGVQFYGCTNFPHCRTTKKR